MSQGSQKGKWWNTRTWQRFLPAQRSPHSLGISGFPALWWPLPGKELWSSAQARGFGEVWQQGRCRRQESVTTALEKSSQAFQWQLHCPSATLQLPLSARGAALGRSGSENPKGTVRRGNPAPGEGFPHPQPAQKGTAGFSRQLKTFAQGLELWE